MKKQFKISQLKENINNPRLIKGDKFKKLVKSIKEFPEMLELRPIVVDENMVVLGGNMRLKACKEAGLKEVWIEVAENLTEEQKKEFIIKDNVGFGEWEWDMLANEWDAVELTDWGLDVLSPKDYFEDGDILFSNELDQQSNYVILKFNTDIDFLNIQTILGLKSTFAKRQNGKPWAKGMGRVVDGIDAILKFKEQ
jgi:hypothetical protein